MKSLYCLPLCLVLLTSCTSGGGNRSTGPGQDSDGFPAPNKTSVYEVAQQSVREQGFIIDPSLSAADAGRLESRWKISLQPFAGQGRRDKVVVHIKDCPNRPGYFNVDTKVERQLNDNIAQPDVLAAAEWTDSMPVPDLEQLINRRIEYYFLGPEASSEFRARYRMDGEEPSRVAAPPPAATDDSFLGIPLR